MAFSLRFKIIFITVAILVFAIGATTLASGASFCREYGQNVPITGWGNASRCTRPCSSVGNAPSCSMNAWPSLKMVTSLTGSLASAPWAMVSSAASSAAWLGAASTLGDRVSAAVEHAQHKASSNTVRSSRERDARGGLRTQNAAVREGRNRADMESLLIFAGNAPGGENRAAPRSRHRGTACTLYRAEAPRRATHL